jgi:hypothetical protein
MFAAIRRAEIAVAWESARLAELGPVLALRLGAAKPDSEREPAPGPAQESALELAAPPALRQVQSVLAPLLRIPLRRNVFSE